MMGSPDNEKNRGDDEGPRHQVTITQDFYLGKYEVTQAQWEAIMGSNPSNDYGVGNNYPVYYVSWNDCQTFIGKMNELGQGLFRLPSEAEWEYACRAGTETAFYWGEDSDYTMIHDYAWFNGNNSPDGVKEVGLKLPNDWGLFDMSGNVAEWCLDVYDVHYYENSPEIDPINQSSETSSNRAIRGDYWYNDPMYCRSANRYGRTPDSSLNNLGFRVAVSRTP